MPQKDAPHDLTPCQPNQNNGVQWKIERRRRTYELYTNRNALDIGNAAEPFFFSTDSEKL